MKKHQPVYACLWAALTASALSSACSEHASRAVSLTAPAVGDALTFSAVSASVDHTCALLTGGSAFCWGRSVDGALGADSTHYALKPQRVLGNLVFAQLVAGEEHTCGLTTTGVLYCWGSNARGQLGTRDAVDRAQATQIARSELRFSRIAVGAYHSCALTPANQAFCWGWNAFGQIGNSSTIGQLEAVTVHGALAFTVLSAGAAHTCGITAQGVAYCWGNGTRGQLGDGGSVTRLSVVQITGLTFSAISAGSEHTCGITTGGAAYCWGAGDVGQLGTGSTTSASRPVPVTGGHSFTQISAGDEHTCAVTANGELYCWGHNNYGRLGISGLPTITAAPVRVGNDSLRFTFVSAGRLHTCALTESGALYCWGFGGFGQLGNGSGASTSTPTRVILLPSDTIRS